MKELEFLCSHLVDSPKPIVRRTGRSRSKVCLGSEAAISRTLEITSTIQIEPSLSYSASSHNDLVPLAFQAARRWENPVVYPEFHSDARDLTEAFAAGTDR